MAEHRFYTIVDLLGNEPTELDEKLLKGRERNLTATGHGFVRNSRDYEWGYTLHKDAMRAGKRLWRVLDAEGVVHAAVYIRNPDGKLEPLRRESNTIVLQPTSKGGVKTTIRNLLKFMSW